jgi:RHS repeat-associated protein
VLGDGHTEYWGNNYVYDAWGNLYQKNVTKCSAENMQATVTAQNRLSGNSYSYDANGNMLYDGLHHYTYDGENRISQVDSGATSYLYDSTGSRVSKTSANLSWTEYVDFGGNVIAERSTLALNSAMLSGSGFASGDFYTGAIVDGSTACCGFETDHESAGTWLQVDLGAGNTQAVVEARIYAATANYPGSWTVQYSDNASTWTAAAINFVPSRLGWNATGWASVGAHRYWRLYLTNTPGPGGWLNELQLVAETNYVFFNGKRVARRDPSGAVHYYLSDHLGSTTMVVSAAGAIENESDYYPWGGELKISATDTGNHYKFTGKERDAESGLDYFGARYYQNLLSRFISADWSVRPETIPYADFDNPQTLNLYRYPSNPETYADRDGHQSTDALRRSAVRQAWKQEQARVAAGKQGTVNWTAAQKTELLQTGRVSGFEGHHINSVNGNAALAGEPNNIKFVEGRAGNLAEHGGSFRNPTSGSLLSRSLLVAQVVQIVTSALASYMETKQSGIEPGNVFNHAMTISDPTKAAATLDGKTIWLGDGTDYSAGIDVKDGKYYKHNCDKDCTVDANQLNNKKFTLKYSGPG